MWRRVELRNFRSIEHTSVELPRFAVLVGPNSSGKSSFADALVFAQDIGTDARTAIDQRGGIGELRRSSRTRPTDLSGRIRVSGTRAGLDQHYAEHEFTIGSLKGGDWKFKHEQVRVVEDGRTRFRLSRKGDDLEFHGRLARRLQEFLADEISPTTSLMLFAKQMRFGHGLLSGLQKVIRYRLNPDEMRRPQLISDQTRLNETGSNVALALRSLAERSDSKFRDLLQAMQKLISGLEDIGTDPVGGYIGLRFVQDQGQAGAVEFPGNAMSEGALRALGLLVAAQQLRRDELMIIEEPEVNVHPGAAQLLFEVLKDASRQSAVLLTTHSPDLLEAAQDEAILVAEYTRGRSHIGPLAGQQREAVRQGLFSVAELMRIEPLRIEGEIPSVYDLDE